MQRVKKSESKGTLKIPISQLFNEKAKTLNHNPSKYSQFSIFYMYWETFRIPARATFKNPNFNLYVNWEKFGSTASVQDLKSQF